MPKRFDGQHLSRNAHRGFFDEYSFSFDHVPLRRGCVCGGLDSGVTRVRVGSAWRTRRRWRWSSSCSTFHGWRACAGRISTQRVATRGWGQSPEPALDVQRRQSPGRQTGQHQSAVDRWYFQAIHQSAQPRKHRGQPTRWSPVSHSPVDSVRHASFHSTGRGCREHRQHRRQSTRWNRQAQHSAQSTRSRRLPG